MSKHTENSEAEKCVDVLKRNLITRALKDEKLRKQALELFDETIELVRREAEQERDEEWRKFLEKQEELGGIPKGFTAEIRKFQILTPKESQGGNKPQHRRYCSKSGMRCAVNHPDGICPDIRDCEACKLESQGESKE